MAREILGNHHRKSPKRWMELRLYGDHGWQTLTNLGCGRGAQRRWTLYCACRSRVACLSELESAIQTDRHNLESDCPEPDEELGSNCRQSQQIRLELGLRLSY